MHVQKLYKNGKFRECFYLISDTVNEKNVWFPKMPIRIKEQKNAFSTILEDSVIKILQMEALNPKIPNIELFLKSAGLTLLRLGMNDFLLKQLQEACKRYEFYKEYLKVLVLFVKGNLIYRVSE